MRRKNGIACAAALGFFCAGLLAGCGGRIEVTEAVTPDYVFTYAENQPEDYPTTQGAYRFAELVKERTEGRIVVEVCAGGILGDEISVVEQVQFGGIDFARIGGSGISEFIPELKVLQLPYLYRDSEHMWQVLDGEIGDSFLKAGERYGMVLLSWYDAGARNFYNSVKPVERLEDIAGMTIRVQESGMMEDTINALGAKAMPMPYGEVYSALETGLVDGAENNWPSYESMGHYKVARYFTEDEHMRAPELQLASAATWSKLTPEDQDLIRECARESALYERKLWKLRESSAAEHMKEAGCIVTVLSPEEKKRFQQAVAPIYEAYCGDYLDMVDAIIATGR